MRQRSTHAERRTTKGTPSPSSSVHRIDSAGNQSSRWIADMQVLPEHVVPLQTTLAPGPSKNTSIAHLDRLVRSDSQHVALNSIATVTESAFERSIGRILSTARWRSGLQNLTQTLHEASCTTSVTVTIVSLADELDGARAVFALAMLHGEKGHDVLVVDGDRHRRTLSILLQHNHAPGLWDAVPTGKPVRSLSISLATKGVSFVAAGNRTLNTGGSHLYRSLNSERGTCRLMLMDAGVWPTADLAGYVPASDLIYAVVRCGSTNRQNYRELVELLKQSGKTLAGCIVSGTFE